MMLKKEEIINLKNRKQLPDWLGILSSGLCLIHCLLLPGMLFLQLGFTAYGIEHLHHFDYAFLVLSFFACCFTSRICTSGYIIALLWFFFGLLALSILLHEFSGIFEYTVYLASSGLIVCHAINIWYCKNISISIRQTI